MSDVLGSLELRSVRQRSNRVPDREETPARHFPPFVLVLILMPRGPWKGQNFGPLIVILQWRMRRGDAR